MKEILFYAVAFAFGDNFTGMAQTKYSVAAALLAGRQGCEDK